MLTELKSCFLEAYDDNQDGKIDIRELAQLLPMEENFLLLFRFDNPLESSVEFMKIWREYDSDNSGYIEADELKVKDLNCWWTRCDWHFVYNFRNFIFFLFRNKISRHRISFVIFWKKRNEITTSRKINSSNTRI